MLVAKEPLSASFIREHAIDPRKEVSLMCYYYAAQNFNLDLGLPDAFSTPRIDT
jgi:hypothetical protein